MVGAIDPVVPFFYSLGGVQLVNALNALMVGSADDAVYLGKYTKVTADAIAKIDKFGTAVPAGLTDRGWISEDGASLELSDSVDKIRGHQGHGVVKTYMSESDTTFTVTFLETQLETLVESLDIKTGTLSGTGESAVAILDVPSSRKTRLLSGVVDLFDVSGVDAQIRILLPMLSLGERTGLQFKVGEIMAYEYKLEVLGGFKLITNAPDVIRDSALFAELLEVPELP